MSVAEDIDWIRDRSKGDNAAPAVLLRGDQETLLLSLEEYEHWLRTYDLEGINEASDFPDVEARAQGATVVITFQDADRMGFEVKVPDDSDD